MEQINSDTLSQTVGILDRVIPLFVWVVSACGTAIVAMAVFGVWLVKHVMKLQKDSNITIVNNTASNVNLTKAIDDLKMVVISRKK